MNYKIVDKDIKSKNINILKQIQKLLDRNQIDSAEQYLKEYIDENQDTDPRVLLKYAQLLRMQVKYDEAIEILESLLLTTNKNYALLELFLIYTHKREYEKASEYLQQLKGIETNEYKETLLFNELYIGLQLNHDIIDQINGHSLNLCYEENQVIGHIIKHHCFDTHDEGKSFFSKDINIKKLFYDVKKMLQEGEYKYYCKGYANCYYFYYKNIGYDYNNVGTSVFVVVVNPNSGIITMYPVFDTTDKSMLNSFEMKETEEPKTYQMKSQIDKFYQRYGKI